MTCGLVRWVVGWAALMTAAVDLGLPGPDDQFGAGRVNAFASLQAMEAP